MITATLIGGGLPQDVQIVVDTVPLGAEWKVTGTAGDWEWTVPGGEGTGDGGQLVLLDNRAPGNVPVTYQVTAGSTVHSAAPITLPMPDLILQSSDGAVIVPVTLTPAGGNTTRASRQATFTVAGRRRPVVRHDVSGDIEGELTVEIDMAFSAAFEDLIATGEPILWRSGRDLKDLPPVAVFAYGNLASVAHPYVDMREWYIPYTLVDDPILDVRLGSASWDEIDDAMADLTWNGIDARFAGLTWDEIDRFDWSNA